MRVDEPGRSQQELLELGIQEGLTPPRNDADEHVDGVVTTQSASWWNRTRCQECGHTFRRGDRVQVASKTVRHLVPGLTCGTDPSSTKDPDTTARDKLAEGLLTTWRPQVELTRLGPDDWRIPRPGQPIRDQPPGCLYCGHTFRSREYVVVCPCTPERPNCGYAVHRDPVAGLPCWELWHPEGGLKICPMTQARL